MEENAIQAEEGAGGVAPPREDLVTISRSELEALRELAGGPPTGFEAGPDTRGPGARAARELDARDRRLVELENACKAAVKDRELATALAGKPLVAGAASQLIKLWRDDFDAHEEGGQFKVAARDGRPVAQVVGEWLASPEFAHFCLPTSRGGSGARDVNRPAGAAPPPAPRNLGEAVVMRWREEASARPAGLLEPIGLRRHR